MRGLFPVLLDYCWYPWGNNYVYFCFKEAISHSAKELGYLISEKQQFEMASQPTGHPINISDCEYVTLFCCDFLKIAEVHYGLVYVQIAVHARGKLKGNPDTSHMNVWVFPINFVVV